MRKRSHASQFTFWSILALFAITTIIGFLWRFTPLRDQLTMKTLIAEGHALQAHLWAPFAIMAIFMAGGLIVFFHVVLLWTVVFIFDPWHALLYTELGTLASALTVYGLGRIVRPEVVERIAGSYLDKVSKALAKKGKLTLCILHWFPICPFSILNFISGATHISLEDFIIGTFVGCTPGLLILVFFGHQIVSSLQSHRWLQMLPWVIGVIAMGWIGHYARRRWRKKLRRL